ncbi:3-hydroxy-9,10-secoandrosta-1,3,5(10)-triene-9,17-dione monooxygenase [Sphingomonas vulcanisoli]|uniref:3-hydroxy-9,10-secoandrosta-1,3,5(10)-triene-9, 17-dione monooxygenase n=1 Tax=Sphingomonas vulcanisoli TaxID=1658060 RepID=A0ABX0TTB4_9SPHN|nr:acyl-CoA dehydrogenase family protein [Sphingomonas vulcanisoli]NIJ08758.1 3-hydroxy-9,10-secoandrosta-1,3,5(10)-triene-9,17-dione monooxygenase [Sphingomonas vulcanisoli]
MSIASSAHLLQDNTLADLPNSPDEAVARAAYLHAGIAKRTVENETQRLVSPDSISELMSAGLFGVMGARRYGGSDLGLEALVRTTIEIATACGSTGWVYGVLAGHSWMLNLFPAEAQEEVASDPQALTATVFRLGGDIVPVDGGYRLTGGTGKFCSGIDHSKWIIAGNAVQREGEPPEPRFFLIPREDVEIVDDWFTVGMRATGSRSVRVDDAFIPEYRTVRVADMLAGTSPGAKHHGAPFLRMNFYEITPYSIVGAPLGMARAAVSLFTADYRKAIQAGASDTEANLLRLTKAATAIEAGIALVLSDVRRIDYLGAPERFSLADRKEWVRNWCWAVQTARNAVNSIYEIAGGSTIYNSSSIQRIWRDINSAAQHFALTEDKAMLDYGRALMGLDTATFNIKKPTPLPK